MALVIVIAGLLIATMVSHGPAGHPAYAQSADSSIEYPENGTGVVGVFYAYDQDGDAIEWSLSGRDAASFTIDGGMLRFREPPNYEQPPSSAAGATQGERNVYRVTIEAGGGAHDVAVTVTDVDEPGTVTIDRPQPQADRPLAAILSDEDEGVTAERWQWARSQDGTTWTDIEGATLPRRSPAPADVGMYLRATVTYADKFGSGKTVSAGSDNRVEARTLSNAAPSFADQDDDEDTPYVDIARSVVENTAVGITVGGAISATDADADLLYYELLDTTDLRDEDGVTRFTIDSLTGQIRVGKVLGADAGEREDQATTLTGSPELPPGETAGQENNSEYVLRVKVSDPSTASATVNVIVTVTNVNEPPEFEKDVPTLLKVSENQGPQVDPLVITFGSGDTPVDADTYDVTDQDADDTTFTYSVTGDDGEFLEFNSSNILGFKTGHEPNFEEQSSYSITIVAHSGLASRRLSTTLDVTIEVVDAEDDGEVLLSQREPQVGTEVQAWVSDPDGGVRIEQWVWHRSDEITVDANGEPLNVCHADQVTPGVTVIGGWEPIPEATSPAYVPQAIDAGRCLRATAIYSDNIGDAAAPVEGVSEAPVQDDSPVNAAPHFVDQDMSASGEQSERISRRVAENTEAGRSIGPPVSAHDDDGDLLIYTLGGADAAFFGISRNSGQLVTKAPLNYEVRRSYAVEVIATDPSGASDSILVTINLTDEDDPAQITGVSSVDFAENGTTPVATFSAHDEGGHAVRWSLNGPDEDRFTIDDSVLRFREPPDYEDPRSVLAGNVYRVTIEANDGTHDVDVTVTDVDEAGEVSIDRPQPQADRPLGAELSDDDSGVAAVRWQWARSGDGVSWTDIVGATSPGRSPTDDDVGMYLRASVTYSDKFGSGKRASAVSANRVEATTLFNTAPSFADQDEDEGTPYIEVSRSVAENAPVGAPIGEPLAATDADEDILFYELLDTPDLEDEVGHLRFTIDSLTGQIRVGEELGADAGERQDEATVLTGAPALPGDEDADDAGNSEYVLRVRVSDPSTASATVNVIVTVADVNEPPRFEEDAPAVLRVAENTSPPVITVGDGNTRLRTGAYAATDLDRTTGPDAYDDTNETYSLSGADRSYFAVDGAGTLSFRTAHRPDFERKSSYSITVVASSGEGSRRLTSSLDVRVNVLDAEDAGSVTLSERQPELGIEIHAMVSDPDGGVMVNRWVWERSGEVVVSRGVPSAECEDDPRTTGVPAVGGWTPIAGASSAVYDPRPADLSRCLRATAIYADNLSVNDQRATGVSEVPVGRHSSTDPAQPEAGFVNAAPVFPDQDHLAEGDQTDRTSRTVAENTKAGLNIGEPVSARDADGDLLIYTLGGDDATSFRIDRKTGQLKTNASLNYEARSSYEVVVTATDPFGAAASIVVAITVTDEDDPAVITVLDR